MRSKAGEVEAGPSDLVEASPVSYPMYEPKPLTKLSICSCGFNVLHDNIPLGRIYHVDFSQRMEGWFYYCGGCGKKVEDVAVVPVMPSGVLPAALFEAVN